MTHQHGDFLEDLHHFLYRNIRGYVYEEQYVGTVKMGEEELEKVLFHPNNVGYNYLAYWKKHAGDGRDSEGSWKLRHSRHPEYVGPKMQVHITLFKARANDEWIDVYAHYEYDWLYAPIKHIREVHFSPSQGVNRCRRFFIDNGVDLYDTH